MKTLMCFVVIGLSCTAVNAEMITLKTGRIVTGEIDYQDSDKIRVDVGVGFSLTYFRDQINSIDVDFQRVRAALADLFERGINQTSIMHQPSTSEAAEDVWRMVSKFKQEALSYDQEDISVDPFYHHVDSTCLR